MKNLYLHGNVLSLIQLSNREAKQESFHQGKGRPKAYQVLFTDPPNTFTHGNTSVALTLFPDCRELGY